MSVCTRVVYWGNRVPTPPRPRRRDACAYYRCFVDRFCRNQQSTAISGRFAIDDLAALQQEIGVTFENPALLKQAFVYRSYLNENLGFPLPSNERLEFLGDAVLGFVVAEYLYHRYPDQPEGELTSLRAALVRAEALAAVAADMHLGNWLLLGKGEAATGGRTRQSLLSRTLESLIGALFIDRGLEVAKAFILSFVPRQLEHVEQEKLSKDYKSLLQQFAQATQQVTPTYRTVAAEGPDHAKVFTVEVLLGDSPAAQGSGSNKQQAQQEAARKALEKWKTTGGG